MSCIAPKQRRANAKKEDSTGENAALEKKTQSHHDTFRQWGAKKFHRNTTDHFQKETRH